MGQPVNVQHGLCIYVRCIHLVSLYTLLLLYLIARVLAVDADTSYLS